MSTLLYNPDRKNKQQFIEEFVVRTSVFEDVFKDIQTGKMKHPEQHYLIVGQRGSGKTTLLNRLKYAIEDDAKLKKWLIPVLFNEEQYHIIELANVWENVASYLEDFHDFKGITEEMEKQVSHKDYEQLAFDILVKHLNKHDKKIVLFIDNIGDLLKKFDTLEVHRLREILQTIPQVRLIAGSPVMLESILDYQQPLFEFFKVIQLKGLTSEETIQLLKKLAEINHETNRIERIIKKTPSRIETLRTLSGGVPRTIALLFMVFIDDEHGNAVSDLEKVLDLVTPLYKHRMDDLPTQQQKIIDAVAKNWDAVSVKELSEALRMESKVISAQLRQLEKNQVIEKRTTNTKNHIYLLRERFFNIWYLMRYGRKQDRQRVVWLVKFLELWCDENEIEKRILDYVEKSKKGLLNQKSQEIYGEVYSFFEKISPETKMLLKESAPVYISKMIDLNDSDFSSLIVKYYEKKDWNKFIDSALSAEQLTLNKKEKVLELLSKDKPENFDELLIKRTSLRVDKIESIPHFYVFYVFCSTIDGTITSYDDQEILKQQRKLINISYNMLLRGGKIDEFETTYLASYLLSLLSLKKYKFALSFFDENFFDASDIGENLKPIYIATDYFAKGKDDIVFSKYGVEIKDSVMKVHDLVIRQQKKLEKFWKNDLVDLD